MTSTSIGDQKVDEMTQKIMTEIENKSSKELAESDEMIKILHLTDMRHAKTLLQHVDEAPLKPNGTSENRLLQRHCCFLCGIRGCISSYDHSLWAYLVPCSRSFSC
jgi:hypothetical protein